MQTNRDVHAWEPPGAFDQRRAPVPTVQHGSMECKRSSERDPCRRHRALTHAPFDVELREGALTDLLSVHLDREPGNSADRSTIHCVKPAWIVLLAACGGHAPVASPPSNVGGTAPTVPDLAGIRAALAPHAGMKFDAKATTHGACPADQTLGEYVALLVGNGIGPDGSTDTHRLTGTCGEFPVAPVPLDPPADPAYWYCVLDSYTSDPAGESPWHYELRMRIHRSDGTVDRTTFGCPGTP